MENLITIQTLNDGTVPRSMLAYETEEQALSALYATMSSSLANENINTVVCVIMSDAGLISKHEVFDRTKEAYMQDNPVEEAE